MKTGGSVITIKKNLRRQVRPVQKPSGLCLELGTSQPYFWLEKGVEGSDHEAAN